MYFRGSELQNYFTKLLEDDLKACIKPQYVDQIPRAVKGTVQAMLDRKDELDVKEKICEEFGGCGSVGGGCGSVGGGCGSVGVAVWVVGGQVAGLLSYGVVSFADLVKVKETSIEHLSGGELQRFACAVVCVQHADM